MNPTSELPVDAVLPEIIASLQQSPNLVIEAAPGAGKTPPIGDPCAYRRGFELVDGDDFARRFCRQPEFNHGNATRTLGRECIVGEIAGTVHRSRNKNLSS